MQVIGIDVGRNKVKAISASQKVCFKSMVGEWRKLKLVDGGEYEVIIDGQKHFVADLAEESYFIREMATESKIHEETKVLFLTALALVAEPNQRLAITTSLPVNQHTPDEKERLINLLRGCHEVIVNGKGGIYQVDQLGIVPESGAAYWDAVLGLNGAVKNLWLASQKVRVVDVGSRTVNYCTINQRKYRDRDSGTLNYGVLELFNAVKEPSYESCENFARRIIADLSKRWMDCNPAEDIILLTGGGSLLLKKWLTKHFKLSQLTEDPVYSNAIGSYKMGVLRWGGK